MKAKLFIQNDDIKQKLKSTGSQFYRLTGRETKPAWGNRIIKDFYDLEYEKPSFISKIAQKFQNSEVKRLHRIRADLQKSKQGRVKIIQNHAKILSNRKRSLEVREKSISFTKANINNPQTIDIGVLLGSSTKQQGLCPFQFQKTIQGRIQKKLSHHLSFEKNNLSRIKNENPIYYNNSADIDLSHSQLIRQKQTLNKFHPFHSYSDRKVFQPKDQLDKIYDTDHSRKHASPKRLRSAVRNFQKIIERRNAKLNESASLTYQTMPSVQILKKKSIAYSINKSQRSISFSPQVILDKRGCKR